MSIGNLKDNGNKGNNFPWQLRMLQLLGSINSGISALPGVDYETRTTMFQATAGGPGYSIGDIIIRYDIIDVATGTITSTLWFNQTTQAAIAAPAPGNITPISAPGSVTVINGPAGAAVNIQDGGNSITIDALALDVALSTRASEATLATLLTEAGFQARINTLGQKLMAASTPVVLASDQSTLNVNVSPTTPISAFRDVAVTNAAVAVKASAGEVWGWNIISPNGVSVYLKIYDLAAGSVVVGTTVPAMTLMIPSRGSVYLEPAIAQLINSNAISIACVTGLADASTTAPTTPIHVEMKYK